MIGNDAGELLPCPMCGNSIFGWARPDGDVAIECRTCGVLGPVEDSALAAITGWNTRAHPASAGVLVEALDALEIHDVHNGYDERGNYIWEDYVRLEDVRALLARQALSTTATPASDGEAKLKEWRASDPEAQPEGTLEALATCASMLETYMPECLPANEHGQVDFVRCMTDATAAEIRAFLANQEHGNG